MGAEANKWTSSCRDSEPQGGGWAHPLKPFNICPPNLEADQAPTHQGVSRRLIN